jgi:uncharacterized membrane protein (DUF106 family)
MVWHPGKSERRGNQKPQQKLQRIEKSQMDRLNSHVQQQKQQGRPTINQTILPIILITVLRYI